MDKEEMEYKERMKKLDHENEQNTLKKRAEMNAHDNYTKIFTTFSAIAVAAFSAYQAYIKIKEK